MDEDFQLQFWEKNQARVYRQIYMRYYVLRFRSKMSFLALKKCMTIKECIIFAILKAYQVQLTQGDLPNKFNFTYEQNKLFLDYIGDEIDARNYDDDARKQQELHKQREEKGLILKKKTTSMVEIRQNLTAKMGLKEVISKDKSEDMFKDCLYDTSKNILKEDIQKWVRYKFNKFRYEKQIKKIKNLLDSKILLGPRFLMGLIRLYQLKKHIFILEFELGNEVLIPDSLSQDNLPLSFRYYDPIIQLIQMKLSIQRREFFKVKKQLAIVFNKTLSMEAQLKKLIQSVDRQSKLNQNAKVVTAAVIDQNINQLQEDEIDHNQSIHVCQIQRSKYVKMNENVKHLIFTEEEKKNPSLAQIKEQQYIKEIDVRYLKPKHVEAYQYKNLFIKAQFLYKLQNFKQQGNLFILMNRIGKWIERNAMSMYVYDTSKSQDENYYDFTKFKHQMQVDAEKMILNLQKEKLDGRKTILKNKMKQEKKDRKNRKKKRKKQKKQNHVEYNEKEIYINTKIEKDIKFFKNDYHSIKRDVYELRCKIANNVEKQNKRKEMMDALKAKKVKLEEEEKNNKELGSPNIMTPEDVKLRQTTETDIRQSTIIMNQALKAKPKQQKQQEEENDEKESIKSDDTYDLEDIDISQHTQKSPKQLYQNSSSERENCSMNDQQVMGTMSSNKQVAATSFNQQQQMTTPYSGNKPNVRVNQDSVLELQINEESESSYYDEDEKQQSLHSAGSMDSQKEINKSYIEQEDDSENEIIQVIEEKNKDEADSFFFDDSITENDSKPNQKGQVNKQDKKQLSNSSSQMFIKVSGNTPIYVDTGSHGNIIMKDVSSSQVSFDQFS